MECPLFKPKLSRGELLALPEGPVEHSVRIVVVRNHGFELVGSALKVYLGLSKVKVEFVYGPYDDSLSFSEEIPDADLILVWLDFGRYSAVDLSSWVQSRLTWARRQGNGQAKILVAGYGAAKPVRLTMPDALFVDCDAIILPLGPEAYDARLAVFAGCGLSDQACLQIARELGCRHIPSLLFPSLKALVIDLDNTLYEGVLGEDGPVAVKPALQLQERLVSLEKQGFMLALASKNSEEDVRELFSQRQDFPLQWGVFAAHAIGWHSKAEGIMAIANSLNIGLNSMLFIDDNPGERFEIERRLPAVRVLPANSSDDMLAALAWYPGVFKRALVSEDALRTADIKANLERNALLDALSPEEYIAALDIEVDVLINEEENFLRVMELLQKTNQFVMRLLRPGDAVVKEYYSDGSKCVCTLAMRDRLADSGIIAVGLFQLKNMGLQVDELAISCRALGRGIEQDMIQAMLSSTMKHLGARDEVIVRYKMGLRNQPALDWLRAKTCVELEAEGAAVLECEAARCRLFFG